MGRPETVNAASCWADSRWSCSSRGAGSSRSAWTAPRASSETLADETSCALELLANGRTGARLGVDHRAERLELQREGGQGVCQDVVDLAGHVVALREKLGALPLHLGPSHLDLGAGYLLGSLDGLATGDADERAGQDGGQATEDHPGRPADGRRRHEHGQPSGARHRGRHRDPPADRRAQDRHGGEDHGDRSEGDERSARQGHHHDRRSRHGTVVSPEDQRHDPRHRRGRQEHEGGQPLGPGEMGNLVGDPPDQEGEPEEAEDVGQPRPADGDQLQLSTVAHRPPSWTPRRRRQADGVPAPGRRPCRSVPDGGPRRPARPGCRCGTPLR